MSIKDWPELERPRERLLANGATHLTDAELLAVLLGFGACGLNAVELARQILQTVGGLRQLLELNIDDFGALPGMGPARFSLLRSALELSRRYLRATLEREGPITSPETARHYVTAEFKALRREVFGCLFLDTRHQVITFETLFYGTLDAATVHPRSADFSCASAR